LIHQIPFNAATWFDAELSALINKLG